MSLRLKYTAIGTDKFTKYDLAFSIAVPGFDWYNYDNMFQILKRGT